MSTSSSTESIRHLRQERDRYVAFAFAAADLLIEVAADSRIVTASGATHAVLGADPSNLVGRSFTDLVATSDRPFVRQLLKQVQALHRVDPAVVHVARTDGTVSSILLGGCRLPHRTASTFLSAALIPDALAPMDQDRDEATGLLTANALSDATRRISAAGETRQLQLVRLDGLTHAARQLPADKAAMLMQEIGAALRASSGGAAGRLSEEAFGLLAKPSEDGRADTALAADLADAIRGAGIPDGQIASRIARIDIALGQLSNCEAGRVLKYAMNAFVAAVGTDFDIASLQTGLTEVMNKAANRFAETREMVATSRFAIVYQPVVDLMSRSIHHYEALSRLPDGADTGESVLFSEDVGLIAEFDLAVCRKVIETLERSRNARVAVNVSGRSVQNADFRQQLTHLIEPLGNSAHRLLFELTESAMVHDVAEAAGFLAQLRHKGHGICLDDFGAGAAAYNYLRRFDVDFVKIDGAFLKAANAHGREYALIRSIGVLCSEIGCKIVGEMIEDEDIASLAVGLGIGYGQGWLFGKPMAELPAPIRSLRRKGAVETWA